MAIARPSSPVDVDRVLERVPRVWREGPRLVVSLRGEQDMSTAGSLAAMLAAAAAEGDGDLVVDLSQVEFMDTKIIMVLIRGRLALQSQSRDLTLRGPSAFARRILDLCGSLGLVDQGPEIAADDVDSGSMVGGTWVPANQHNPAGVGLRSAASLRSAHNSHEEGFGQPVN
jgi:anti-anti-sigma factor